VLPSKGIDVFSWDPGYFLGEGCYLKKKKKTDPSPFSGFLFGYVMVPFPCTSTVTISATMRHSQEAPPCWSNQWDRSVLGFQPPNCDLITLSLHPLPSLGDFVITIVEKDEW
jgi:hypothetical protein